MAILVFLRSAFMSDLVPAPEQTVVFPSEEDVCTGDALEAYVAPMAKWLADYLLNEEVRAKWKE